jgi:hypothetical protein
VSGRRASNGAAAVTAGFLGGLLLGAFAWSGQIRRSRRDLFSKSLVRRFAALGYLSGQPGFDSARLLTDYVGWEQHPVLRRRGQRLLHRMQTHLE